MGDRDDFPRQQAQGSTSADSPFNSDFLVSGFLKTLQDPHGDPQHTYKAAQAPACFMEGATSGLQRPPAECQQDAARLLVSTDIGSSYQCLPFTRCLINRPALFFPPNRRNIEWNLLMKHIMYVGELEYSFTNFAIL